MRELKAFILGLSLYLLVYLINGEICPAPCICKKLKTQSSTGTDLFKAQCGGIKNKINSLDEIDFTSLAENLVQLDLSSNLLTTLIPNLNLPILQKLDLSKNKLTTLEPNTFKQLPNLRRLDLSSNSLKYIHKDWLNGLTKLERLKINGNQINTIIRGTFDDLTSLKQLDISSNPLTCDCELLWLLDWLQNTSAKFITPPKCAAPFKDRPLRKLKIGVDIHCRSPVGNRDLTELELKPDKNQIVYEGDNIKIKCRAPGVIPDVLHLEEPYSSFVGTAYMYWRFNLEDPIEKFRDIKVENRYSDDSGIFESILNIGIISRNHSGQWTCNLSSDKGNHSKSVSLVVISNSTKYCPTSVTTNNKGTYIWPRTIVDNIVEQQCQGHQLNGLYHVTQAIYQCTEFGTWANLNTTACPYISEVTKILEQFSKVNLNLTKGNFLESVRHLKNYTSDGRLLKDKVDIVFIARTIENYISFVKTERELGGVLIDIVSSLLNLNKKLLEDAQIEDKACTRLVKAVEIISEYTPPPQSLKSNMAVDDFRIKPENFHGLTCAWYSNNREKRAAKPFFCTTSTNLPYMTFEDELIEASIQIPASLFIQLEQQGYQMTNALQLTIAMYDNNKFFPNYRIKEVVTSPIVGATLENIDVSNLSDPVTVMYRYPLLQDVETPILGWWDMELNNGIGGWNKNGCELSHYFHESLIFSCDRLNYFAMLQDVQFAPTSFITGAKFHFSHPAIYAGTFVLILCLFITILTYLLCFNSIQMAKRAKHSLINTWIAICFLVYIFSFGIYQTEDIQLCQIIGIILHYLSLSVLLWMCVSVTTMYKRLSKSDSIHLPVDELPPPDQPIQKPILGLYLVGWGIALIVCGISGAVNMREYASHSYCFLYSGPALSAIFVPAFILIVFIIICSLMIRCAIRCSDVHGQLSEGTQATENVDLDLLEPNLPNISIDRHSFRSISSQTASSNIEDPEHCPSKQLKAHIIVLIFYLFVWIFGALTARRVFKNLIPYDERIFSILYAVAASMLGAFILFFYGVARSDVRCKWAHAKRVWCRTRSISDTNMNLQQNLNQPLTPLTNTQPVPTTGAGTASISGLTAEINNSRSSSRTSSRTKSQNSNILKGAVDLNNVNLNDPDAEAKIANVNLVVLHRQQYRTNNTIPIYSDNGSQGAAEMFYNPHQSTVARKFFKKQRKNMIKHNNLGTRRTRGDGSALSDSASIVSGNKNTVPKTPHKTNIDIKNTNIFGSGTKINNINIHIEPIKEAKQQNKNILSDSGDESEILIDHVTGSVSRILAERESLRQKYTKNNDGSPKKSPSKHDNLHDKTQQSSSNNEIDDDGFDNRMRTVSQQCSLEYSSGSQSDPELDKDDADTTLKLDTIDDLENNLVSEVKQEEEEEEDEEIVLEENLECNLTPENNEGMYSITDISQNLVPDDNSSSIQNDYAENPESAESVHSHVLYPHMPRSIYENPLHSHFLDGSTTTLDSETLFHSRYQPSEASVINSVTSDCDDCDDREGRCAQSSPVSASELDELYEQINRPPQVVVHNRPNYLNESRSRSPILFPPSISFESGLDDIEVNTDFRFNAQGIVATSSRKLSNDLSDTDSDEIKIETTV